MGCCISAFAPTASNGTSPANTSQESFSQKEVGLKTLGVARSDILENMEKSHEENNFEEIKYRTSETSSVKDEESFSTLVQESSTGGDGDMTAAEDDSNSGFYSVSYNPTLSTAASTAVAVDTVNLNIVLHEMEMEMAEELRELQAGIEQSQSQSNKTNSIEIQQGPNTPEEMKNKKIDNIASSFDSAENDQRVYTTM